MNSFNTTVKFSKTNNIDLQTRKGIGYPILIKNPFIASIKIVMIAANGHK